jgi:hypothetical protein
MAARPSSGNGLTPLGEGDGAIDLVVDIYTTFIQQIFNLSQRQWET